MVGNWKPDPVAGPWIRPWTPHWTPALQRMRSKGGNFQSSRLVNFEPNGFVVTLKNKLINGVLKPQKKVLTEELQGNLVEHGCLTFWCVLIAFRFQPQSYVKLTSEFWWCGWMVSEWNRKCEIHGVGEEYFLPSKSDKTWRITLSMNRMCPSHEFQTVCAEKRVSRESLTQNIQQRQVSNLPECNMPCWNRIFTFVSLLCRSAFANRSHWTSDVRRLVDPIQTLKAKLNDQKEVPSPGLGSRDGQILPTSRDRIHQP